MSISSHVGIVILVIVGMVTVLAVIIIAAIESRRMDKERRLYTEEKSINKK